MFLAAANSASSGSQYQEESMQQVVANRESDRDLERRVKGFLYAKHMPGLRNLQVEASNGTVILRGQVGSFYEKQLGHQCCRRVAGVQKLIDSIDVVSMPMPVAVA
jgi:osmotically-inducible protein OsmY